MMSCSSKMRGARKAGWLNKRGGRIHTWHKRWFVLTGDLLFYYKSPQDSRPTGTIPLVGNKVIRHPDDSKQPSFRFEIVSGNVGQVITGNHQTYLISTDSAEMADSWVCAIRRVMHEPYGGGMFGRSLEETMKVEGRLGGTYVPVLLHRCAKFVREHGLKEVGIFRLPGQASRIQTLKELYDAGSQEDFTPSEDVHTVASLLKLYLKELPEPVVPFQLYNSYIDAIKLVGTKPVEGSEAVRRLLLQLPNINFNVLKYLCRFLYEVHQESETNKMNSVNLGTIFGPHLLRPNTEDPHVLMECNNVSADFVKLMLDKLSEYFPFTSDEKPPKRLSIVIPPGEVVPWMDAPKCMAVQQRSYYNPKTQHFRHRQNSAPLDHKSKSVGGKVMSMVEQFNLRSRHSSTAVESQLQHSVRDVKITAPVITSPVESNGHNHLPPPDAWTNSPLYPSGSAGCSNSDEESEVDVLKDLSLQSSRFNSHHNSDTLSSDIIVNSISTELEGLEQQLAVLKDEVSRYKKTAKLWKRRYEQEHQARVASEHQVRELQQLIDETFQQFALDDSEDDFDELDSEAGSTPNLNPPSETAIVQPRLLSSGVSESSLLNKLSQSTPGHGPTGPRPSRYSMT